MCLVKWYEIDFPQIYIRAYDVQYRKALSHVQEHNSEKSD